VRKNNLRYRRIVLAMDQDVDGMHIASLMLMNVHKWNPTILEVYPAFVQRLATPLIVAQNCKAAGATGDDGQGQDDRWFYARAPFDNFYRSLPRPNKLKVKYLKGLGSINVRPALVKRML